MGFHNGLRALLFMLMCVGHCCNSKITFPRDFGSLVDNSPTKSSIIVTATPTPSSDPSSSFSNSDNMIESPVYSLFPQESVENITVPEERERRILFPNEIKEVKEYIRSLEIMDSREDDQVNNPDRRLRDRDEDVRWNGWNFEQENKRWTPPDEKTIAIQVLDNDPYHHGRPAWPHDEYLLGFFDLKGLGGNGNLKNASNVDENPSTESIPDEEIRKYYEWKKLQPKPPRSSFIGPGFYDVGSSSNYIGNSFGSESSGNYYKYYQPSHQSITTDGTGKVQTTGGSGGGSSGEGPVPGSTSESNTDTRGFPAYVPHDFYKRKRVRLSIHPGLIAAPLAGLAAFGAASALTSKPLLVELGYVRNKHDGGHGGFGGGGHGGFGGGGQGGFGSGGLGPGGWGWAGNVGSGYRPYPAFYPPPNGPPLLPHGVVGTGSIGPGGLGFGGGGIGHAGAAHGGHGGGGPIYPILKPIRHRPDSQRSSWWNPFAGLTPRLVIE